MPATANKRFFADFTQLATTAVGSQFLVFNYDAQLRQPRRRERPQEIAREAGLILRNSARVLELVAVGACALEALAETGAHSADALVKSGSLVFEHVKALTGLDAVAVVKEAQEASLLKDLQPPPPGSPLPPLPQVVTMARTIIESCPITDLEKWGGYLELQDWSHRCRIGYDALRAFVRRCDPSEYERLGIVGREYARGALSLNEVAALLRMDSMDAVVLLEEHGYFRPVETIVLSDEERQAQYARIREDRLGRAGKFQATTDQVARDVIASERIEGVDARPWMRPDAH